MVRRHLAALVALLPISMLSACDGADLLEPAGTEAAAPYAAPQPFILPSDLTLRPGEEARLTLMVRSNERLERVPETVTWASMNPDVAQVSADGVVKAVGNGRTTIRALGDGIAASARVRVN